MVGGPHADTSAVNAEVSKEVNQKAESKGARAEKRGLRRVPRLELCQEAGNFEAEAASNNKREFELDGKWRSAYLSLMASVSLESIW